LLLGTIHHSVIMQTPVIQLIPLVKAAYISEYLNVVFENLRSESSEVSTNVSSIGRDNKILK